MSTSRIPFNAKLLCALYLASFHAGGANVCLTDMTLAVANRDFLNVRTEYPVGDFKRVADVVACHWVLSANLANL